VRVRGLKPCPRNGEDRTAEVAPRAGAWVETISLSYLYHAMIVAPRAGAWVETHP